MRRRRRIERKSMQDELTEAADERCERLLGA